MLDDTLLIVGYLMVIALLGYLGYRKTKTTADYLIAGRRTHPFIMAMSYGATFISTAAIVGFGGVAGMFGMSILWLVFLNIFVGIFIAFVFLGGRTRRMGHHLDAHTFPELLGKRYGSRFIQVFAGMVIFLFIPLYASAVLIGGCEIIVAKYQVPFDAALLVFSAIIALYVITGGLKGAMYAEALQGTIILISMAVLLVYTYVSVGGITAGHEQLTRLAPLVPEGLQKAGHRGWTAFPKFGWGGPQYNLWWITVSTIILGVGIGVLAQPQLVVRFMTVKSQRELNRAVILGSIFILLIPGTAYVVGSLSNTWFASHGPVLHGTATAFEPTYDEQLDRDRMKVELLERDENGGYRPVKDATGKARQAELLLEEEPEGGWPTAEFGGSMQPVVAGRSISLTYAGGDSDQIMPTFITSAMPAWFSLLFMLTILAAAMSTSSSQFHALGSAIGRDVYETLHGRRGLGSIGVTRVGIIIGILLAVTISHYARGGYFIARATAIFFGLCASTFLPAFVGGLYFRWMTRAGAIASMIAGFAVTAFWLVFVKAKEAQAIGLVTALTGKSSILAGRGNWAVVDSILIALPISILVAVVVSLLSPKASKEHLDQCFAKRKA